MFMGSCIILFCADHFLLSFPAIFFHMNVYRVYLEPIFIFFYVFYYFHTKELENVYRGIHCYSFTEGVTTFSINIYIYFFHGGYINLSYSLCMVCMVVYTFLYIIYKYIFFIFIGGIYKPYTTIHFYTAAPASCYRWQTRGSSGAEPGQYQL